MESETDFSLGTMLALTFPIWYTQTTTHLDSNYEFNVIVLILQSRKLSLTSIKLPKVIQLLSDRTWLWPGFLAFFFYFAKMFSPSYVDSW